jgi:intracellular septation protein A
VAFKLFGVVPLTFIFAALQFPLMTKHALPDPAEAEK